MSVKSINGIKPCKKCRTSYKVSDVFSESKCPKCETTNRELLSWSAYILDIQMRGLKFSWLRI